MYNEGGLLQFVLAPHMDGGGIERWKDRNYRSVYRRILEGNPDEYDPFEADFRAVANMNELGSACTFFRMFQGWLATSASGERDWAAVEGLLDLRQRHVLGSAYF